MCADGETIFFVALSLSLAAAMVFLIKHSSLVWSLLPQTTNDVIQTPNNSSTSTISSADGHKVETFENSDEESSGLRMKVQTADTATQTVGIDNESISFPSTSARDAFQPSSVAAAVKVEAAKNSKRLEAAGGPECLHGETPSPAAAATMKQHAEQMGKREEELERYIQLIGRMEMENKQLRDRLAEQAKSQLHRGPSKFEDLSLGEYRPSALIKRYSNIYHESRLEAWEELDQLPEFEEKDDSKDKLLFSIVFLCFHQAHISLQSRFQAIREILEKNSTAAAKRKADGGAIVNTKGYGHLERIIHDIEDSITSYLQRTISHYDVSADFLATTSQLWNQLHVDRGSLKECHCLLRYIEECVKVAWALSVQNPPYDIEYDAKLFSDDRHTRFHTSDPESVEIRSYLWPTLVEKTTHHCVSKAVVITRV